LAWSSSAPWDPLTRWFITLYNMVQYKNTL
jgi:hypothetical protein